MTPKHTFCGMAVKLDSDSAPWGSEAVREITRLSKTVFAFNGWGHKDPATKTVVWVSCRPTTPVKELAAALVALKIRFPNVKEINLSNCRGKCLQAKFDEFYVFTA